MSEEDSGDKEVSTVGSSAGFWDEDDIPQNNNDEQLLFSPNHVQNSAGINEPLGENDKTIVEQNINDSKASRHHMFYC